MQGSSGEHQLFEITADVDFGCNAVREFLRYFEAKDFDELSGRVECTELHAPDDELTETEASSSSESETHDLVQQKKTTTSAKASTKSRGSSEATGGRKMRGRQSLQKAASRSRKTNQSKIGPAKRKLDRVVEKQIKVPELPSVPALKSVPVGTFVVIRPLVGDPPSRKFRIGQLIRHLEDDADIHFWETYSKSSKPPLFSKDRKYFPSFWDESRNHEIYKNRKETHFTSLEWCIKNEDVLFVFPRMVNNKIPLEVCKDFNERMRSLAANKKRKKT